MVTASGTFASGKEYADFVDLSRLGAVMTKGVSYDPWAGNASPRIAETASGMLNSIGLQNPGVEAFAAHDLAWLAEHAPEAVVIVNVSGHSVDEYARVIERLERESNVAAYEVNISCPNVDAGGMAFGTDCVSAAEVTARCRRATSRPLIVKLSPNVTDIVSIARSVEAAGADAVSLINTLLGMAIDVEHLPPEARASRGRFVRAGDQARRTPDGLAGRLGRWHPDRRHGRHHERRGRSRVHARRCDRDRGGNRELRRPRRHDRSGGWSRGLLPEAGDRRGGRTHRGTRGVSDAQPPTETGEAAGPRPRRIWLLIAIALVAFAALAVLVLLVVEPAVTRQEVANRSAVDTKGLERVAWVGNGAFAVVQDFERDGTPVVVAWNRETVG